MTVVRTWSVGLAGVSGAMVEVEVDMSAGVPGVALVGLPDAVVRQSVDRVRARGHQEPLAVSIRDGDRRVDVVNEIVSLPADGSAEPVVLVSGHDFFMAPRLDPAAARIEND